MQIALWQLVAVESLEATKLVISPYPEAQLQQFFFFFDGKIKNSAVFWNVLFKCASNIVPSSGKIV